ncbi:response regulator transcription factor [Stenotrophomonas sp.]|uniref:response regulator transcription factor n=1 Tax=Stenotrophomonas sp. TaxID=69392 RepID=UPI0028AF1E1F|nr:response regulator transcription factor [Stenotrophomonas sp.]
MAVKEDGRGDPAAPQTTLEGLHVWVVEDDPELLALSVDELRWRGAQVRGLDSAEALYRHLAVERCDIVVLDIGLPGEDGYAVARHLRSMAEIGIVMLTGRGSTHDMTHGLAQGADVYLVKPVAGDLLAAALVSLRRRLHRGAPSATGAPAPSVPSWQLQSDGWSLQAPNGKALALTGAERGFLRALMVTSSAPVERETLIAAVTDTPWDFDPHRLDVLVHRLRSRVQSATGLVLPVRALRGAGYLWTDGAA